MTELELTAFCGHAEGTLCSPGRRFRSPSTVIWRHAEGTQRVRIVA